MLRPDPYITYIIFFMFVFILSAHAQAEERLDITAKSVEGDVEIMVPNTSQWIPLKTGDTFSEETQVRTGPLSSLCVYPEICCSSAEFHLFIGSSFYGHCSVSTLHARQDSTTAGRAGERNGVKA